MNDQELLLKSIRENPLEMTPRLMYSDWLREHGQEEAADQYARLLHHHSNFDILVGRKILAISTDFDTWLSFVDDKGSVFPFSLQADCCSHTWFFRFLNIDKVLGEVVVGVAEGRPDVDAEDGHGTQEYDSVYNYCLLTAKGGMEITFRNSSNGYYGGWIRQETEAPESLVLLGRDWQVPPFPPQMECSKEESSRKCRCVECVIPSAS